MSRPVLASFQITEEQAGPAIRVIAIEGEVEPAIEHEFAQALDRALETEADTIVVDLLSATFAHAEVVQLLTDALSRLIPRNGRLIAVCCVEAPVRMLLVETLGDRVELISSRAEAMGFAPDRWA